MSDAQADRPPPSPPPWLEVIDGSAPILLIAPHGGRAAAGTRHLTNPKVNDLYTAEITHELAARLRSHALINVAMDRNRLDCNRLSQLLSGAPWLLAMMAERIERIVAADSRAIVIAVHGWNLVEPRIDIGVGLRQRAGILAPAGGAWVSVSGGFLDGTLAELAARLKRAGIASSFGMRYPAGGAQNLLQTLTERHSASEIETLRRLARLSALGVIEAVQVELSMAVRLPGTLRRRMVESFVDVLGNGNRASSQKRARARVARGDQRARCIAAPIPARKAAGRLGFELFDPSSRVGVMASVDVGGRASGGRIMALLPGGAVALFTGEGVVRRTSGELSVGPLHIRSDGRVVRLEFRGPALLTPDATTYSRIEQALAMSSLDEAMELEFEITLAAPVDIEAGLGAIEESGASGSKPRFGRFTGRLQVDHVIYQLAGVSRVGSAVTAISEAVFDARRTVWACFASGSQLNALELKEVMTGPERRVHARMFDGDRPMPCRIRRFELASESMESPPGPIRATIATSGGAGLALSGKATSFVPLARSGPNDALILTALGFAKFDLDGQVGAGMFEYSRRFTTNRQPLAVAWNP